MCQLLMGPTAHPEGNKTEEELFEQETDGLLNVIHELTLLSMIMFNLLGPGEDSCLL